MPQDHSDDNDAAYTLPPVYQSNDSEETETTTQQSAGTSQSDENANIIAETGTGSSAAEENDWGPYIQRVIDDADARARGLNPNYEGSYLEYLYREVGREHFNSLPGVRQYMSALTGVDSFLLEVGGLEIGPASAVAVGVLGMEPEELAGAVDQVETATETAEELISETTGADPATVGTVVGGAVEVVDALTRRFGFPLRRNPPNDGERVNENNQNNRRPCAGGR